jgi:hypothetical protein
MGYPNTKGSEQFAILGGAGPLSISAAQSAWIPVADFHRVLALIATGVATGTLDASLQQAQDATGTGAKPIIGAIAGVKALATIPAGSASNIQALIDCSVDELDITNGFAFVQLQVAMSADGLVSAFLLGVNARFDPASALNAATVAQIVG